MAAINDVQTFFVFREKQIPVDIFAPKRAGKCPIVCALHGSGGLRNVQHLQFAQLLADQGFLVCVPHYFEVTGTYWADDATIWREFPLWQETISAALDFVSTHEKADTSLIGLVGFSLGAYLALALAVEQPRIKAVVDFFGGMPAHSAEMLKTIAPVLILHGDADYTVPVAEAHKLQELLKTRNLEFEMKLYRGAGHGFRGFDMMDAGKRTYDFLKKHLSG